MTLCMLVAALLINEVLYDPAGSDSGREFVELLHADSTTASWTLLELQAGDGAHPGTWKTIWQARDVTLHAGELLLVGGDEVAGASQRLSGSMQNGPDAVRLMQAGRELDRLGYGNLTDPSMFEGAAAIDVRSASLARIPDGHDTQDNAADFHEHDPTPGRRNLPQREWRLSLREPEWYRFWPQRHISVTGVVHNQGAQATTPTDWQLMARLTPLTQRDGGLVPDPDPERGRDIAVPVADTSLQRGDSLSVSLTWQAERGLFQLEFRSLGTDEWSEDNVARLRGRVGTGDIVMNELLYAPENGQSEWIELWNRSTNDVSLQGWTLQDASGRRATLHVSLPLSAGSYAVVRDDAAVDIDGAAPDALPVAARPWLSLNNTDDANGIADVLILRDAGGLVQDAMFYSGGATVRGRSLERLQADADVRGLLWRLCKAPQGSTPGRANSVSGAPASSGQLELAPNPFTPDGDGLDEILQVHLQVPEDAEGFHLRVFDLQGRLRRDLAGDRLGPGPRQLAWDGSDDSGIPVEMGVYIIHLDLLVRSGHHPALLRTVGVVRP
jgi:hypothetical protein